MGAHDGGICLEPKEESGIPGGSVVKNPPASAGNTGSIPGSGRSPGGGNDNPFQYSCLKNPTDRGVCPNGHKESDTTEQLSNMDTAITSLVSKTALSHLRGIGKDSLLPLHTTPPPSPMNPPRQGTKGKEVNQN